MNTLYLVFKIQWIPLVTCHQSSLETWQSFLEDHWNIKLYYDANGRATEYRVHECLVTECLAHECLAHEYLADECLGT